MKTYQEFITEWRGGEDFTGISKGINNNSSGGFGTNPNKKDPIQYSPEATKMFEPKNINNAFAQFVFKNDFKDVFLDQTEKNPFFKGTKFNKDIVKPTFIARNNATVALANFFNKFTGLINVAGELKECDKIKPVDLMGKLNNINIVID